MSKKKSSVKYSISTMAAITAATAIVPSVVTADSQQGFPDVSENNVHKEAIYQLVDEGVIQGFNDGTFRPYESITRAQVAVMLYEKLGLDKPEETASVLKVYKDVAEDHRYAEQIAAVTESGVFKGDTEDYFSPYDKITRQQMATVLVEGFGLELYNTEEDVDINLNKVSDGHDKNVQILANLGITNQFGDSEENNFEGHQPITRAQFSTFLIKAAEVAESKIVSVESFEDVSIEHGTALEEVELPETVTVTFDDDSTKEIEVDWDLSEVDTEELGEYNVTSSIVGYEDVLTLKIIVEPATIKVDEIEGLDSKTVELTLDSEVELDDDDLTGTELTLKSEEDEHKASYKEESLEDGKAVYVIEDGELVVETTYSVLSDVFEFENDEFTYEEVEDEDEDPEDLEAEALEEAKAAIEALPEEITLEDKDIVEAAREAVQEVLNLNPDAEIEGLSKLEAAEEKIAELEAVTKEEAIEEAIKKISSIGDPEELTLEDESKVQLADEKVTIAKELGAEPEDIVNIDHLEAALHKIEELKNELNEREKAIQAAKVALTNLPMASNITLEDKDRVQEARNKYEQAIEMGATAEDFQNIWKLEAAESKLEELEDVKKNAIHAVESYEAYVDSEKKVKHLVKNDEKRHEVTNEFVQASNLVQQLDGTEKAELMERLNIAHDIVIATSLINALQEATEELSEDNLSDANRKLTSASGAVASLPDEKIKKKIKNALLHLVEKEQEKIEIVYFKLIKEANEAIADLPSKDNLKREDSDSVIQAVELIAEAIDLGVDPSDIEGYSKLIELHLKVIEWQDSTEEDMPNLQGVTLSIDEGSLEKYASHFSDDKTVDIMYDNHDTTATTAATTIIEDESNELKISFEEADFDTEQLSDEFYIEADKSIFKVEKEEDAWTLSLETDKEKFNQ